MISKKQFIPFESYQPIIWNYRRPKSSKPDRWTWSTKRDHGVKSKLKFCRIEDSLNKDKSLIDSVIIQYLINGNSYDLFRVSDFLNSEESNSGFINRSLKVKSIDGIIKNAIGEIGERISRRIVKKFLQKYSKAGKPIGLYCNKFDPIKKDYIVRNTENYILKIDNYPNLVILKRDGKGKFGYKNIKEIDGFFAYRFKNQKFVVVLESKIGNIDIDPRKNYDNLFKPLKELYPEAFFSYILFGQESHLYDQRTSKNVRKLRKRIVDVYKPLMDNNIGFMAFTFNENASDFERLYTHIETEYQKIHNMDLVLNNRTEISKNSIVIYDNLGLPYMKLFKQGDGVWKEMF